VVICLLLLCCTNKNLAFLSTADIQFSYTPFQQSSHFRHLLSAELTNKICCQAQTQKTTCNKKSVLHLVQVMAARSMCFDSLPRLQKIRALPLRTNARAQDVM
jgi:hypothetical protein